MVLHKNIKGILNIRDEITPAERHLLGLYLDGLRPTSRPDQLDIGPALSPGRKTGRPRCCVLLDLAVVLFLT